MIMTSPRASDLYTQLPPRYFHPDISLSLSKTQIITFLPTRLSSQGPYQYLCLKMIVSDTSKSYGLKASASHLLSSLNNPKSCSFLPFSQLSLLLFIFPVNTLNPSFYLLLALLTFWLSLF